MSDFNKQELRARAFQRIAFVLHHYWEEQKNAPDRAARVHSRIFDTLIYDGYINIGTSVKGGDHREHLVPCAYLRDLAFQIFWEGGSVNDVALMLGRLLRIAYITREEARKIDIDLRLKTKMPHDWNPKTGSVLARLQAGEVNLLLRDLDDKI